MRTTIRMNEELARRAKAYALRTNRSFTQVVEEAVAALLSQEKKERSAKRVTLPPPIGDPNKKITEEQYRSILEKMNEEDAVQYAPFFSSGSNDADPGR